MRADRDFVKRRLRAMLPSGVSEGPVARETSPDPGGAPEAVDLASEYLSGEIERYLGAR
jgi:hypothetical protein